MASVEDLGGKIYSAAFNDHEKCKDLLQELKNHKDLVAIVNYLDWVRISALRPISGVSDLHPGRDGQSFMVWCSR